MLRSRVSEPVPPSIFIEEMNLLLSLFHSGCALANLITSSPAPAFTLESLLTLPINSSSPAPRSAVAFSPSFALTISSPAPVLMLFATVLPWKTLLIS